MLPLKIRGSVALVAIALLAGVSNDAVAQNRKPRVAVMDFKNTTRWWQNDLSKQASDQLVTEMVKRNVFDVVEREELQKILDEMGIACTDLTDSCIEPGKIKTIDYLIFGTIGNFNIKEITVLGQRLTEAEAGVNVRVVSTTTAKIEGAFEGSGKKRGIRLSGTIGPDVEWNPGAAEAALSPAIENVAKQLAGIKLASTTAEATPPKIAGKGQDGSIYISQGEDVGVKVGQRYEVRRIVDRIVVDGKEVDVRTRKVGVIEVTEVLSRSSVCKIVEGEATADDMLVPITG